MLILGVDTSGKNGSIALVDFAEGSSRTLEIVPLEGGTFSAQLIPQISGMLDRHNLSKRDVGGFAAVAGPGSFTGLRVGLAAIKGLAEVLQKPIAALSLLEAIGRISALTGEITAMVDAGRSQIYAADFSIAKSRIVAGKEALINYADIARLEHDQEIVTPDEKIVEAAHGHGLRAQQVPYPGADFIAKLGFEKIGSGPVVSTFDLDANYIRRSDAEIKKGIV
ncbi:MAG TPA: tRNA (adenosine(37)-N6)-threonylcarbamoyltransferase complex dimerization subunit type 1 TsaB [Terriglobales bacterium]|nr:tRNA (adenosine(37)-N6)-threonylcarbamoyltransferase complex dimerization subunit type 1 TsaB [Terriglobales bacterium]